MPSSSLNTRRRKRRPSLFTCTAVCASGLENLVADELAQCGVFGAAASPEIRPGAVSWQDTSLAGGYRACLWSRFASRILLEIARFDAPTPEALYERCLALPWDEHLDMDQSFAVFCTAVNAAITNSQFAALKVKDAIADQFRRRFGRRPNVDPDHPDLRLHLHLEGTGARLSVDLSGESLHRRGYRVDTGPAPLKETLAAALARLSGWMDHLNEEPILLDPMCGGGTLLIEAALMLCGSAPGLSRKRFGFMGWMGHDPALWERLTAEALDQEQEPAVWPQFIGYDADPRAVSAAQKNVIAAGLRGRIVIHQRELAHLKSPGARGCLLVNPPYGERLADRERARCLYRALGRIHRERFAGWRLAFFTANTDFADLPAVIWEQTLDLRNGPLKCRLFVGHENRPVPLEPKSACDIWQPRALASGAVGEDFANRLRKNFQGLADWIGQEGIHCFRLYDADLPDYNLAVDCYGEWLHVQEYAAPASVDTDKAKARRERALAVLREVMGAPRDHVFVKTRRRQKGPDQYHKKDAPQGRLVEVREADGRFLVNFADYLDTGLFLDHRPLRALIRKRAAGKHFLNLFGYTGAASVFAALGGALSTTTVDASAVYLARAGANLALNGFGGPLHRLVEADCMGWLAAAEERFGLILVDPPTFSNSKKKAVLPEIKTPAWARGKRGEGFSGKRQRERGGQAVDPGRSGRSVVDQETRRESFDIQRDHVRLLRLALARLEPGGLVLFSTNFRKFALDEGLGRDFRVTEISAETIAPDFRRNPKIHRVWAFRQEE